MGKIEQAIDRAIKRERIRLQEAETARQMVAPLVGNIAGMDSAIEIYSNALKQNGIAPGSANISGMQAMVRMLLNTTGNSSSDTMSIATDATPDDDSILSGVNAPRKL